VNPGKFLGVPLWSLAVLSVRTFNRSGNITRHNNYCDGQFPPPKQSEYHCSCDRIFLQKR